MTDEIISVTIQEDPLPVLIDNGTPAITITDSVGDITVIEATPIEVIIAEGNPQVTINSTGYGGGVGINTLLSDLIGRITTEQMEASLVSDLSMLEDLWIRIGNEIILTYPDGVSIQEAGRDYTDTSITDAVIDMNVTTDGKLDVAYSVITQNADTIDQRVTTIEDETDDRFEVNESSIHQTAEDIESTVTRLTAVDGEGGSVEILQSSIKQTAESIDLEIERVDDELGSAQSSISLLVDSVDLLVKTYGAYGTRITTTEVILGEDGINLSVLSESLVNQEYEISTVQTLLENQWGVEVEEDINGNTYATNFGLILHPTWLIGEVYALDSTCIHLGVVYQSLIAATATIENGPLGTTGSTHWVELPDGVKSEFAVNAESFKVRSPDGLQTLFSIGVDDKAYIAGDLLVQGLESYNYGVAGESWFKLDPTTGTAEFNNISMTFSYDDLNDKPSSLAEINPTESTRFYDIADNADVTNYEDPTISNSLLENDILTISRPGGATYSNSNEDINGAIVIVLPQSGPGTMLSFDINVLHGESNKSFTLRVSGYAYDTTDWSRCSVSLLGSTSANNRVRFGHNGTNSCIVIGSETDVAVWSYLYVYVTNLQASLTNYAKSQWEDGWAITRIIDYTGYTTSFDFSDALVDSKDTLYVDGVDSNVVRQNAEDGATFTSSNAKALAYLDKITDTVIDDNAISAQKINATNLAALSAYMGSVYVNSDLTVSATGEIKSLGKDSYTDSTQGFFLGPYNGKYSVAIGDSTKYLKYTDGVLSVGGSIIATDNVVDDAITQGVNSYASSVSLIETTWKTVATCVITPTGGSMAIRASFTGLSDGFLSAEYRVRRDTTTRGGERTIPDEVTPCFTDFSESPSAGTEVTYTLQVYVDTLSSSSRSVYHPYLDVVERKK